MLKLAIGPRFHCKILHYNDFIEENKFKNAILRFTQNRLVIRLHAPNATLLPIPKVITITKRLMLLFKSRNFLLLENIRKKCYLPTLSSTTNYAIRFQILIAELIGRTSQPATLNLVAVPFCCHFPVKSLFDQPLVGKAIP